MSAIDIAASGLNAAVAQMNVTANNIANVNTPGFKASRVNLIDHPTGGVSVDSVQSTGQSVNLAHEMANLSSEKTFYDANAMVLKASAHMSGTLLNILDNDARNSACQQD